MSITVAYADDHVAVREGITSWITKKGNIKVIIQASNGEELITMLEQTHKMPDVVLMDISMPTMNGFETQVELMKRWPTIKTLVLTVHDSELYTIRIISAGARGYLLKNSSASEIERAIVAIHTEGIYHSDISNTNIFNAVTSGELTLPQFTEKEIAVLKLCCSDLSYVEIADQLGSTKKSVEGVRDSLFKKLKASSRTTLVLHAIQLGIIPLELPFPNQK